MPIILLWNKSVPDYWFIDDIFQDHPG